MTRVISNDKGLEKRRGNAAHKAGGTIHMHMSSRCRSLLHVQRPMTQNDIRLQFVPVQGLSLMATYMSTSMGQILRIYACRG